MYSRTFRSVLSLSAYSPSPAYQVEVWLLTIPRRIPVGCTFCPITPALLLVGYFYGDVTSALNYTVCTTFSARHDAFHAHTLIYKNRRHFQLIDISAFIVLCVCNGRFKHFLNYRSALFWTKAQNIKSIFNAFSTNLICNQTRFLRRQTSTA